tara:strand:+ start:25 stop:156 length:132 start_codon:yes stop_codon:yes gene_type:complete
MNTIIPDVMIYVISIISTIVILIDLRIREKKREIEEKNFKKDV